MKRVLLFSILASVAFVTVADQAVGKGHVPLGKAQVCHKGQVIGISESAVQAHVTEHGDCQLPACDFNNIFHNGESCQLADRGDGKCAVPNPRDSAEDVTPGCPAGTF